MLLNIYQRNEMFIIENLNVSTAKRAELDFVTYLFRKNSYFIFRFFLIRLYLFSVGNFNIEFN